jgi:aspartate aminotransferase
MQADPDFVAAEKVSVMMPSKSLFADRLSSVKESSTVRVMAAAHRMKAEGIDIVDLSVGEPDFNTPENIKNAARRAIDTNQTRYTATPGMPVLRDAVVSRYQADFGVDRTRREVIINVGGKQAIFNALMAIVNPGDEVLIPAPYWVTFPPVVYLCGGTPVIVETDPGSGFQITADALARHITDRTKLIIINSPSNPSGAVVPEAEFFRICELAAERGIFVLSDECYQRFLYDGLQPFTGVAVPESQRPWIIVVGSLSKTYAMTGWRIGYTIGSAELIERMSIIQSHQTSNPTSIAQVAAIEALTGPQDSVTAMTREFQRRRNYIVDALNRIPGIHCFMPQGAFYAYPDFRELLKGDIKTCEEFAAQLLEKAHLALTAGCAFGTNGFIRFSYAASMSELENAMSRLADFVSKL